MRSAMNIVVSVSLWFAGALAAHAQGPFAAALDGIVTTAGGAQPEGTVRIRLERFGRTIQERFSAAACGTKRKRYWPRSWHSERLTVVFD